MVPLKSWQLVWFFCLLIMLQSLWLSSRLNIAFRRSPEAMQAQVERKQAEELAKVPEAKIEVELAKGGRLWFEPKTGKFEKDFPIEIWAEVNEPVKKIDLRIFYSPLGLEFLGELGDVGDVGEDESAGLVSLSKGFEEGKEGRFLVETLQFRPKIDGETELEFDFDKESLSDCNLINESGEDILEEVEGGKYKTNLKTQI